jgi:hypothetical protein
VGGVVVHGDDFYRPLPSAERLALDAAQGYRQYFDWERLRDQVLQPLRSGGVSRHQHYDWGSGEVGGEHHEVAASGHAQLCVPGAAARPWARPRARGLDRAVARRRGGLPPDHQTRRAAHPHRFRYVELAALSPLASNAAA